MAWVQSHQSLLTHRKTGRFARALGVSKITAIGHLHVLWWWCLDNAPDGDLSDVDSIDIAEGGGWEGDPAQFVGALAASGFLDPTPRGYQVHDWQDYAGRLIDQRRSNAERQRTFRERRRGTADVTPGNAGGGVTSNAEDIPPNGYVTVMSPLRNDAEKSREEKRREEDNRGDLPSRAPAHIREDSTSAPTPVPASDDFDELTSARQERRERAALAKAAPRPIPCPAPATWPPAAAAALTAHAKRYPQITPDRTLEWFHREHRLDPPRLLTEWVAAAQAALDSDAAAWTPHPGTATKNGARPGPRYISTTSLTGQETPQ